MKYLRYTKANGLLLKPNVDKGVEVYANADFSGSWIQSKAEIDTMIAKSRSSTPTAY